MPLWKFGTYFVWKYVIYFKQYNSCNHDKATNYFAEPSFIVYLSHFINIQMLFMEERYKLEKRNVSCEARSRIAI